MNSSEIERYQQHYSERGLWSKIGHVAKVAGVRVIYLALLLYYVMLDPKVSLKSKTFIVSALGYFILPIDVIPDALPGLGYTDDFALLIAVYTTVKSQITPETKEKARAKLFQWFPEADTEKVEKDINEQEIDEQ